MDYLRRSKERGLDTTPNSSQYIKSLASKVGETFALQGLRDSMHDTSGSIHPILASQLKACKKDDPSPNQKVPLPPIVYHTLLQLKLKDALKYADHLVTGDYFFGCRSCEYLEVPYLTETKITSKEDICMWNPMPIKPNQKMTATKPTKFITINLLKQKN